MRVQALESLSLGIVLTCALGLGCGDDDVQGPVDSGGSDSGAADVRGVDVRQDAEFSRDVDVPPDVEATPDAGAGCALTSESRTTTDSGLTAMHHHGQSFVSWTDRAVGEAGQAYRYRLYRSTTPIESDADLLSAELIADRIPNNSGQLFGYGFRPDARIDPDSPMSITEQDGEALPLWSGLWVANANNNGCAFYAVVATNPDGEVTESVQAGINATTEAIAEFVEAFEPFELYSSDEREGPYVAQTRVTGTTGLPLEVILHASNAQGGPVRGGDYGDYYLYFGDETMGYQEGLPGVFSVQETHSGPQYLRMRNRDTVIRPDGRSMETYWFGYVAQALGSEERFAHPFTERRLDWMVPWAVAHYEVDENRVYATGGSMGAWGSMTYAFRRADVFAAVYPNRPRVRQTGMTSMDGDTGVTLPSGESWADHHDSVLFVRNHPEDLPFLGWNCGRNDGFATWQEQVDLVQAMSEERHGFAFSWNDGDHSSGTASGEAISLWYPYEKFALNESYPAFSNSSIDDDLGNGDPEDGDLEGGINLGFNWTVVADETDRWELTLSNALATAEMSVDVTPRRRQLFAPAPGEMIAFSQSNGETGVVMVDEAGRVTIPAVILAPGDETTLSLTR